MTITVSIDPGKNNTGYGIFRGTQLVACGVSRLSAADKRAGTGFVACFHSRNILTALVLHTGADTAARVVCEEMRMSKGRDPTLSKAIATANDLFVLTTVGAYVAGFVRAELSYQDPPMCPKEVTKNRVLSVVSSTEFTVLQGLGKHFDTAVGANCFDGVFHGMYFLGRFGRGACV